MTKLYLGLVLTVLSVTAAQCGPLAFLESPTPVPPVVLTYLTFSDQGTVNDAEELLIEQFEAGHPNITVSRTEYAQSPQAYLTASPPPDIMLTIADYNTFAAIDDGLVLDISTMWSDANLAAAYPASLRAFGERQGRQYFLPVGQTWTAFYYNRQLFEANGLAEPTTWNELLDVAETLWLSGVTPFALTANDGWALSMWFEYLVLRLHGPEFYQQLIAGEIPYTDFRVREVFELWRDLLERGYFGESSFTTSTLRAVNEMSRGQAAMVLVSPVLITDLPAASREQLDLFPFPVINPDLARAESAAIFGYLIPARSQHPAEAIQFFQYMTSADVQAAFFEQLSGQVGVVPAHQAADPSQFDPEASKGLALLRQADTVTRPFIFSVPEASTGQALILALRQFIRNPDEVDSALESLEQARQEANDER